MMDEFWTLTIIKISKFIIIIIKVKYVFCPLTLSKN